MEIKSAQFIGSFPRLSDCPKAELPEYAFIGRSNVGKSSLINLLCRQKQLAHTSNKPGKTQLLNYFLIDEQWYLVDLPGYGYARTSKRQRRFFSRLIEEYFLNRQSLYCAFVLIDANVPPQEADVQFINWLGENGVPFVIVYTKTDRLSKGKLKENIEAVRRGLLPFWNELPREFVTSAKKYIGGEEILEFIIATNAHTHE